MAALRAAGCSVELAPCLASKVCPGHPAVDPRGQAITVFSLKQVAQVEPEIVSWLLAERVAN